MCEGDSNSSADSSCTRNVHRCIDRLQLDQDQLQPYCAAPTNGHKMQELIHSQPHRQAILASLWHKGYRQGNIYLQIGLETCYTYKEDLVEVFGRFGQVVGIYLQGNNAIVALSDPVSAVFAERCLNRLYIPELMMRLIVSKLPPQQQSFISDASLCESRPLKFTCRFLIQISNERDFQVARRIIGNRGLNMKKIIDSCSRLVKSKENQIVKLRLRGRGSGYKEGPNQAQSDDPLHLCISSKYEQAFRCACDMVEVLLQSIYQDHFDYCKRNKKAVIRLKIQKMDTQSQSKSLMDMWADCFNEGPVSIIQINQLIEARNNARRSLNFSEADRIREFLRVKGIAVIDEKGGRGSGSQVTSWKYIKQLN